MDYSSTLNLPRTDFPMRAGLPKKEPGILKQWEEYNLFHKMRENRKGAPRFVLHDGPPYANGNIHMGTALNKVLKDIVNKFWYMQGYDIPYVPGWDTHGLPVEHQVIKTQNIDRKEISDLEFRKRCHDYALHYLDVQREQFKRLGVVGDWENPYITLNPGYEAVQIGIFGQMAQKGFIYKGLKPVYWCPQCETALAEAEVEYRGRRSPSIYVKFRLTDNGGKWSEELDPAYVLIWTTTPWTIPANHAVTLHPEFNYLLIEAGGNQEKEYYLVAEKLADSVFSAIGKEKGAVLGHYKGRELEGLRYRHPLYERESKIALGQYVTLEQGTGCVHTAPGHGYDDYETGLKYDLPIYAPMDGRGIFTEEAGEFAGLQYDEGNKAVTKALEREEALLDLSFLEHQYPHCWRCKSEVIFRATEQWFASVKHFREEALKAISDVNWMPSWGEARMRSMITDRQDWCISRQRVWGVPLPIFYCQECDETLLTQESIKAVQELFEKEGSDGWFKYEAHEILPSEITCSSCEGSSFRKEEDIMDVWFDSGVSHAAVLEARSALHWPAELYLEGSDQFRGWFQSSLLTAVAARGNSPYRGVLTHGWVVDGEGRKMSKSMGNVISPEEIIEQYGADILRLWVSSADFTSEIHLSPGILKQLSETYRKIRNTCRFLLGNCNDFDPEKDGVDFAQLEEIDRWALHRLYGLTEKTKRAYKNYELHQVFHALHNFAVVDMSNLYLDIVKDRLYVPEQDSTSRRAAQTVLAEILRTLTLLISPVLSFTADEIWNSIPFKESESVFLKSWPELPAHYKNEELERRWDLLFQVKEEVNRALEEKRREKHLGNSLEAGVELFAGKELYEELLPYESFLATLLIVSQSRLYGPDRQPSEEALASSRLDLRMNVFKAEGEKCQRCWVYSPSVGDDHPEICGRCIDIMHNQGNMVAE